MSTLQTLIPRHARYRPSHPALIFGDQRLTYHEFQQRINQLSHALHQLGLQKGDKIATILPNSLELVELYWACAQMGWVIVPLSPLLRGTGLARLLNDSDSVAVVTNQAFLEHLHPLREQLPALTHYLLIDSPSRPDYHSYHQLTNQASTHLPPLPTIHPDDPYNIIYSSGTTGLPKGILHTHAIRIAYCTSFATAYRITPESVILHTGSLVFNGAFLTFMPAFFLGCTYILHSQFDPRALIETVAHHQVTHIKLVPSQIIALLHQPDFNQTHLPSLQMVGSVGAPLHLQHKQELDQRLPGRFYELYGLTEGFMTILDKNDYPRKPNSVGTPPPLMEMRIVRPDGTETDPYEVGEITGRGPMLMPGYYKRPDLTANTIRHGWLHSGDLGYLDEDGFLYLIDRQKDLIISGGVNVYPRDIEEIVVQHPAVREAAVFGVPHPKWGETPLATVILHQANSITPAELQEWINARVEARYQQVQEVVIVEEFPRSVAGKTLKRVMRDQYWQTHETKI